MLFKSKALWPGPHRWEVPGVEDEQDYTVTSKVPGSFLWIFELPNGPFKLLFPIEYGDLEDTQWQYDPGGPFREGLVDVVYGLDLNRQGHILATINHAEFGGCGTSIQTAESLVYYNPSHSRPFLIQRFEGGFVEGEGFIMEQATISILRLSFLKSTNRGAERSPPCVGALHSRLNRCLTQHSLRLSPSAGNLEQADRFANHLISSNFLITLVQGQNTAARWIGIYKEDR